MKQSKPDAKTEEAELKVEENATLKKEPLSLEELLEKKKSEEEARSKVSG